MSGQGAVALSGSLAGLLRLTQLDLIPGFYDQSGLSGLCPALQRLTNLRKLVLACSIDLQVQPQRCIITLKLSCLLRSIPVACCYLRLIFLCACLCPGTACLVY